MILKEQNEVGRETVRPFFHSVPISTARFIHRKTITYDSDPVYELQEMINDGWILEKREMSNYYHVAHHTLTMVRYADELNPSFEELPIPSNEDILRQVSGLFKNRWIAA